MPRIGRLVLMSVSLLAWMDCADAACPFCPPAQPTIAEQLAGCDIAVLVKWNRLIEQTGELEGAEPQTEFIVAEPPLKASQRPPKPGDKLVVNFRRDGKRGDLLLLVGTESDGLKQWDIKDVTLDSYQYIKQAPSLEKPPAERLTYFLKFLEVDDPLIGNDAFSEFSQAKYADVAQLAPKFSREKLRRFLDDPADRMQIRHGFYGLLLGLCGNEDDARYLASRVLPDPIPDQPRLGVDGMMAGYVLLSGKRGLTELVNAKLRVAERIDVEVLSALAALRFLWEFAPDRVPRIEVVQAVRLLLDDEKHATVILADLARWQDWDVAPQVLANYGRPPFDDHSGKQRVVQFALAAQKALSREAEPPPLLTKLQAFLDRVRRDEPDIIRFVERAAILPAPPSKSSSPATPSEGKPNDRPGGAANGDP